MPRFIELDTHVLADDLAVLLGGPAQGCAQFLAQVGRGRIKDVHRWGAGRGLQVTKRPAGQEQNFARLVDHRCGRGVLVEHGPLECGTHLFAQGLLARLLGPRRGQRLRSKQGRPGRDPQLHRTRGYRIDAAKDPAPLIHGLEEIGQRRKALGRPEEKITARPEGAVKERDQLLL